MKTRFLCGGMDWQTYGAKFITKKLSNGDWNYWLVLDFMNLDELAPEIGDHRYEVSILAVSPEAAGDKHIKDALECCGVDTDKLGIQARNDLVLEALLSYGVFATLQTFTGSNYRKVLKEARAQLDCVAGLFGFYMDRPENRVGHTGWDFIEGDLSLDKVLPKGS